MSRINEQWLSDRWRILPQDYVGPVTLYPRQAGGYGSAIAVGKARRHPTTAKTAGKQAVLTETRTKWSLWTQTFSDPSYEPRPGDRLTDADGNRWLIGSEQDDVEKLDLGQRWNVNCRQEL